MPRASGASRLHPRRALAFALAAVFLASAAPGALAEVALALRDGVRYAGEDVLSARRRFFPEYADGIDAIQRRLPRDARYVLVEGGRTPGFFFVQFDLAPRRAMYLGSWYVPLEDLRRSGVPKDAPEWTVVSYGLRKSPVLARTADLVAPR